MTIFGYYSYVLLITIEDLDKKTVRSSGVETHDLLYNYPGCTSSKQVFQACLPVVGEAKEFRLTNSFDPRTYRRGQWIVVRWNYFRRSWTPQQEIQILIKEGNERLALELAAIKTARKNSSKQNQ